MPPCRPWSRTRSRRRAWPCSSPARCTTTASSTARHEDRPRDGPVVRAQRRDRRGEVLRRVPDVSVLPRAVLVANRGEIARRVFGPAAGWASAPSPSSPTPTATLPTPGRPTSPSGCPAPPPPRPTSAASCSSKRPDGPAPTPSTRVRVPLRGRRLRPGRPRRQAHLDRPAPEAIEAMGSKLAARPAWRRPACRSPPGRRRHRPRPRRRRRAGRRGRLSRADQGQRRGRRCGMRLVRQPAELHDAVASAQRKQRRRSATARCSSSGTSSAARHVEVQVLADRFGETVHLFGRECSIQRRHQKIVKVALPRRRRRPAEADRQGGRHRGRRGRLRRRRHRRADPDPDGEFAFLEMNTRLQVEHPVTELVTGLDLVEMARLGWLPGEALGQEVTGATMRGHAIEETPVRRGPGARLPAPPPACCTCSRSRRSRASGWTLASRTAQPSRT